MGGKVNPIFFFTVHNTTRGLSHEVFTISRVESGWAKGGAKCYWSGRVGSGRVGSGRVGSGRVKIFLLLTGRVGVGSTDFPNLTGRVGSSQEHTR